MATAQNLRVTGDRIEQLLEELRTSADPRSYRRAEELLQLVTDLYGAGLARIVEMAGERSPGLMEVLVEDELVASLFLVHELHPDSLVNRVQGALARVRPLLARHDGDVELVDVDEAAAAVLIRLMGSCDGCPSSAVTLQSAVERAILEAAPEVVVIDVDQASPEPNVVPVYIGTKPVYDKCPAEMAEA
jgi:Fe-S cluster biogenesis protein NfuA